MTKSVGSGGHASTTNLARPTQATRALMDWLRANQRARWRQGDRVRVEDYLGQYSALRADPEGILDLIYNELFLREQAGESPPLEEFLRRFPQFSDPLKDLFDVHRALDAVNLSSITLTRGYQQSFPEGPQNLVNEDWPTLPGHDILRELGRGGMGVVYLAYDRNRDSVVALKTMRVLESTALYRFKQEFRALADVTHPNLVTLYQLISDGHRWFITMEYVEGVNFLAYVRPEHEMLNSITTEYRPSSALAMNQTSGPAEVTLPVGLSPVHLGRLRSALRQLAEGVAALHEAGKLHCDIKPTNVLVARECKVALLDFGLATEVDRTDRTAGGDQQICGTAAYMAPEQAAGRPISPASDWYSVGVMLYEALTGQLPFRGKPLQVLMDKQQNDSPAPSDLVADLPEDLNTLCVELLRRQPLSRPPGMEVRRRLGSNPAATRTSVLRRSGQRQGIPFVGRELHLAALHDAFRASRQHHSVAVYVHGRSGMGKSALVQRFLDDLVRQDEAVILAGRCYESESVPYKALDSLIDALSRYLGRLPRPEAEELLPQDVAPLVRVFPVLRRVEAVAAAPFHGAESPDQQVLRRRAFAGLRELLARLGKGKPLVLFIDDLQWGDMDSAVLLSDLFRPPESPALLLLGSYRSEYATTSPCLQVLLQRQGSSETALERRELVVDVLAPNEARDLALDFLGQDEDPATKARAEAIARESGGNPYFVRELVQFLQEGTDLTERSPAAEKIHLDEVLWQRMERLPEKSRRLLEVVAVCGQPLQQTDVFRAAALAEDRTALAVLRVGRLIRSTGPGGEDQVEPYHDRIRETVLAHLPAEKLRTHHRLLAATLETSGQFDPEMLAVHFLGAEDLARAEHYYTMAADKAAEALAFNRAAKLYRQVLSLPSGSAATRALRTRLGDALANAGRGAEAAREYLGAATGAAAPEALELRRRAAVQFSISGHFDEGLGVMRTVLGAVGLKVPTTPQRALASLLWHRAWLRVRGLGFRPRAAMQIPPAELTRLDICWSAVLSLGVIDIIRGADFQARGLLLALRAGEPFRITRALALEAIHTAAGGGPSRATTATLLQAADHLVGPAADPYILGIVQLAHGASGFLLGEYPDAWRHLRQAEEIFRDRCTGVGWELDTARTYGLWSLLFLGEFAELSRLGPVLLKDAQERGDLFAATNLKAYVLPMVLLGADNPEEARQSADLALAQWSQQGFHAQHLLALFSQIEIDLYTGDGLRAWKRISAQWPAYQGSLLTRVQNAKIQMLYCHARSALAAAVQTPDPRALLRTAEKSARRLDAEKMSRSTAQAQLIRAGLAIRGGDQRRARSLLASAADNFGFNAMHLHAAAARRRLGQLLNGPEGDLLVEQADAWMTSQKIRKPAHITAALVPGFPD